MGTYPAYTCAKATSTYTYTSFGGNSSVFADVKTTALYSSNTSTNTYGWLAQACTSSLAYVCEMPRWAARAHAQRCQRTPSSPALAEACHARPLQCKLRSPC
jgi:hypothetical protein